MPAPAKKNGETPRLAALEQRIRVEEALNRVRAEIATMRSASDLLRITPIIWRELTELGVPFFRCGIFIMNEDTRMIRSILTTPQGRRLATLDVPYELNETTVSLVDHWRQKDVFVDRWDKAQFIGKYESLAQEGLIQPEELDDSMRDPPESLVLHFVPFTQGMLYVGNASRLGEEHIAQVRALAEVFSIVCARYEDFRKLEARSEELVATLRRLEATQAQLLKAEKLASLGQLTAGIAHEIKNPLNFVNNFSSLSIELVDEIEKILTRHPSPSPARTGVEPDGEAREALDILKINLQKINEHGRRVDRIIHSMMQHASGSKGQRRRVQLNSLVEEYVNLAYHGVRARLRDFNVAIEPVYDASIGEVNVAPQEIGQVLINLFNNAFDAMRGKKLSGPPGYAPRLHVETTRDGAYAAIHIADNGPGISDEIRDRIFEPFFTTKPPDSGTGLGLSLSYDIVVKEHGGRLLVDRNEFGGATFSILLPV